MRHSLRCARSRGSTQRIFPLVPNHCVLPLCVHGCTTGGGGVRRAKKGRLRQSRGSRAQLHAGWHQGYVHLGAHHGLGDALASIELNPANRPARVIAMTMPRSYTMKLVFVVRTQMAECPKLGAHMQSGKKTPSTREVRTQNSWQAPPPHSLQLRGRSENRTPAHHAHRRNARQQP